MALEHDDVPAPRLEQTERRRRGRLPRLGRAGDAEVPDDDAVRPLGPVRRKVAECPLEPVEPIARFLITGEVAGLGVGERDGAGDEKRSGYEGDGLHGIGPGPIIATILPERPRQVKRASRWRRLAPDATDLMETPLWRRR